MIRIIGTLTLVILLTAAFGQTAPTNYTVTNRITTPGITDQSQISTLTSDNLQQAVTYFNGSGVPVQQIIKQGSPSKLDLVSFNVYDNLGRSPKQYLPYAEGNNGLLKTNTLITQASFYQGLKSDDRAFTEQRFENSPLNRVLEVAGPGIPWQMSSSKTKKIIYEKNVANDIRLWNFDPATKTATGTTFYAPDELYGTETRNEQDYRSIQYSDKDGKVIYTKEGVVGTWNYTYYVYDVWGNLRFTIPPEATANLSTVNYTITYNDSFCKRWLFANEYDQRFRVVEKSVPGAGITYFVYDAIDRVVLTQNELKRNANQWIFFKYDVLGRSIMQGIYQHTGSVTQAAMQGIVDDYYVSDASHKYYEKRSSDTFTSYHGYTNNAFPALASPNASACQPFGVNYYDDYDFDYNGTPGEIAKGEPAFVNFGGTFPTIPARALGNATGGRTLVLGTSTWLTSATYYNSEGLVSQMQSENYSTGARTNEVTSFQYNFSGLVTKSEHRHRNLISNNTFALALKFRPVYDHRGAIIEKYVQIDNQLEERLAAYSYNELGEVIKKTIGSAPGLQATDYQSNIRGWLTNINGITPDIGPADYFTEQMAYNVPFTTNTPRFDGMINATKWKHDLSTKEQLYDYTYDTQNRLQHSNYKMNKNGAGWNSNIDLFSEKNVTYDRNGNIKSLDRYTGTLTSNKIDQITYDYGAGGNQLLKVTDAAPAAVAEKGFNDGNITGNDYAYDVNGNLIQDLNKSIQSITYNSIDLPEKMTFANGSYIKFLYDATGTKLSQSHYNNLNVLQKNFDYQGAFVYEDGQLQIIFHDEGRIVPPSYFNLVTKNPDAGSLEGFATSTTYDLSVEVKNSETYVKAVCKQSSGNTGLLSIGGLIDVKPGKNYAFKMLGYQSVGTNARLIVKYGSTTSNIVWPGAALAVGEGNETWATSSFTVPAGVTQIRLGVYWSGAGVGNTFYINKIALYETNFEYQYFLQDHLGSPRVVLQTNPAKLMFTATMESENYTDENSKFLNLNSSYEITYSAANSTPGGNEALKMNANYQVGPSRTFKVLPGDVIDANVMALYSAGSYSKTSVATMAAAVIAVLADGNTALIDGIMNSYTNAGGNAALLLSPNQGTNKPSAFLNYILFDAAYTPIEAKSAPLGANAGVLHPVILPTINIKETGHLFIYLSYDNETGGADVFFDDLKIQYQESPVIQVNAYYPYGMTAYSWVRDGEQQNKYLYQGKEYNDSTQLHDFHARQYDASLGRWFATDPADQFSSPYVGMGNNPVMAVDPNGEYAVGAVVIGAVIGAYIGGTLANDGQANPGKWDYSSGRTWSYMVAGAVVGGVSGGVGSGIAASGIPFANTAGIVAGSAINSVGTYAYTGGKTDVSVSFGAGSYNFSQNEWGYIGKKGNSVLENVGYGLGAIANISDAIIGFKPGDVELRTENDPNYTKTEYSYDANGNLIETEVPHKDLIGHSQIVDPKTGKTIIDWGPASSKMKFGGSRLGTNQYDGVLPLNKMKWDPVSIKGVNVSRLTNYGNNLSGKYNIFFNSCVTQTSRALNMSGVLNVGIHPYILQAQMYLRSIGVRPMMYSYQLQGN